MSWPLTRSRFRKLISLIRSPFYLKVLLRYGVAASTEHLGLLRAQLFSTVVDIGANRGQFALAARRHAPAARIFSFEPLVAPATIYRSIFALDSATILHQVAIGPKRGESIIHLSARDDSSSLLPISRMQSDLFPGTAEVGTETVYVAPLDAYMSAEEINAPALLKLDVQGFELEALKGCDRLLGKFDCVYVECSFVELYRGQKLADAVIDWLHHRGLFLSGVFNTSFDSAGKAIQADFLFARRR